MSKFNTIEISHLVGLHPKVESTKFLGLFERVVYQPTHSPIHSFRNYYDSQAANILLQISETASRQESLQRLSEIKTETSGNYRLDLCISDDHNFVAFQVFERQSTTFVPFTTLCFLEGPNAMAFEDILG